MIPTSDVTSLIAASATAQSGDGAISEANVVAARWIAALVTFMSMATVLACFRV
jgi:hypothetical protein